MSRFLAIAGTPGTGKKTLAPAVAVRLGLRSVALNGLLTPAESARSSEGIDPRRLRGRLLARARGNSLVYGHLVADVLEKGDIARVVVLRCDPMELRRRLGIRGYPTSKVTENVEAELIGVVSADCVRKFGRRRCFEFDTTSKSVEASAAGVAKLLGSSRPRGAAVDWVPHYSSAEKLRSLLSGARTDSALT
jgi:adenylate kinase